VGVIKPFCNFVGRDVDVEILNLGPCLEVGFAFVCGGDGGVDRAAEPGRFGIGDSVSARCEGTGEALNAGAEAIGRGPPVRPVRLPNEFKLVVSSSCR
jgi:hypothetical protein